MNFINKITKNLNIINNSVREVRKQLTFLEAKIASVSGDLEVQEMKEKTKALLDSLKELANRKHEASLTQRASTVTGEMSQKPQEVAKPTVASQPVPLESFS